jgi:Ran GTPase-activating protein (RanGAP) involved in mRNA processing and transport
MTSNPVIQELCRRCKENDRTLRDISLQALPLFSISQQDVEHVVSALQDNTNVKSVDLTTAIADASSPTFKKALIDMIELNTTISRITTACCDPLLDPLLVGMSRNRSITTLSIGEATLQESLPCMTLSRQWELALRMNTTLTRLVLSGINLSTSTVQAFEAGFCENNTLHSMEFCQVRLESNVAWTNLYQALGELKSLRMLHLISCKCSNIEPSDEKTQVTLNCLENLYELRCIDHGDKSIFAMLGKRLSACQSLRILDLRGNRLTNVTPIAEGLTRIFGFRKLVLEDNELDCKATTDFCQCLFQSLSLRFLNVRDNKIGARGAQALASSILSSQTFLEVIDVSANPIGSHGVAAFGIMLTQNKNLRALHLESVGLDCSLDESQTAMSLLAVGIARNSSLQTLSLGGNRLGYEGAELIKLGLTSNGGLRKLVLPCCRLGNRGIASLSEALQRNRALHELIVPFNEIGDTGIEAFGKALPWMFGLAKLHLEFNSFTNYDELVFGLSQNMRLEYINVMNEHFLFRARPDPLQKQLDFLLCLNRSGRRILQHDVACEVWPVVLENALRKGGLESVFYLLSQRPEVFKPHV